MRNTLFLLIGLLMTGSIMQAQTYTLEESSSCTIKGTSNISDWTAVVNDLQLEVQLGENFLVDGQVAEGGILNSARMDIAVLSIDGGKGETMNDNIFEAFNEPQNPTITFQLQNGKVVSVAEGQFTVEIKGILSMAGQRQLVSLSLSGKQSAEGQLSFLGHHTLKMTDFGMEPPTAMFGAIEAGDEVVIEFNLKLISA